MGFLDHAMGITAGISLLGYALYSLEASVFVSGREFAALPFAAFVVLDYLRLAQVEGKGDSPVDMVLREPTLIVAAIGFALAVIWSLQLPT